MEERKLRTGIDCIGAAVVFACHDGNGKFLFAKRGEGARDGHGTWEIPAGGIEYGESVRDALHRELKEELCCEPIAVEDMGYKDVILRDDEGILKHWITFEFLVHVDPQTVRIGEPDSCAEIVWRTIDDAPLPLHYGVSETIGAIKHHLRTERL